MRTLVALTVGLLAIPLAAAARPAPHSSLTLSASTTRAVFGHAVVLSGRLTGGHVARRAVTVAASPYGATGTRRVAAAQTDAAGRWHVAVRPRIQTTYVASADGMSSVRITVGVQPRLSLARAQHDTLRLHVVAGAPLARRLVQLQMQNADGSWTTIERRHLDRFSRATLQPPARPTLVRVAMSVNQAGAGYLGAIGAPFVYPAAPVSLATSARTVLYGHRVTLTGRVANGRQGQHVAITAHPYGRPAFTIATVTTGHHGVFHLTANPTIMTLYQARTSRSASSLAVAVDVRPTITVKQLANGRVQAHVLSAAFLYGRSVLLQLRAENAWKTIAKRRLDGTSSVVFARRLAPRSMIRVAMSINQAGDGYVGSASHPLVYRGV